MILLVCRYNMPFAVSNAILVKSITLTEEAKKGFLKYPEELILIKKL